MAKTDKKKTTTSVSEVVVPNGVYESHKLALQAVIDKGLTEDDVIFHNVGTDFQLWTYEIKES